MDILYKERDSRGVEIVLTIPKDFKPPQVIILESVYPGPAAICIRQYQITNPE